MPLHVLRPGNGASAAELPTTVRLRPLTVADLQTIGRAAKESDSLTATLMVHRALVEPELTIAELTTMHVGLLQFLLERVNELSGVSASADGGRAGGRRAAREGDVRARRGVRLDAAGGGRAHARPDPAPPEDAR